MVIPVGGRDEQCGKLIPTFCEYTTSAIGKLLSEQLICMQSYSID